jgi:hypothetical protein
MSEKKVFVIDSQKLNSLQLCMRHYLYNFGKSFEPLATPIQFDRGTLLHHGLEYYYKAIQVMDRWPPGFTQADAVSQAVDSMRRRSIQLQGSIEELETVIQVFIEYCEHYKMDGWNNILFVEKVGSKILFENDTHIFLYETKLDLGIGLSNMPLVPVDHKSFSRKSQTSDMSNQFKGYCWALGVNNIVINKIGFYAESSKKKPEEKFMRDMLSYTKERLDEWEKNAIFWIRQGLAYIENDLYPMNETSCDKFNGCTFRQVCMKNPEDRQDKLNELFKIRERQWDVGSHLE